MGLSSFNNQSCPIIGDASAIINLNATGCAPSILRAVPNQFIIIDVVLDELQEDVRSGRDDAMLVSALVAEGLITVAELGSLKNDDFERLVSGATTDTLDDGEAATIAYASELQIAAVIDERKATRICRVQYPELLIGSTVDLLALEPVERALGRDALANAAYAAPRGARMRVLSRHLSWIVALIGSERAAGCSSLPGHARGIPSSQASIIGPEQSKGQFEDACH